MSRPMVDLWRTLYDPAPSASALSGADHYNGPPRFYKAGARKSIKGQMGDG